MLYTHRVVRRTPTAVFGVLDPCIAPPAKFSFHCLDDSSVSFPCAKADAAVGIAPPFALISVSASGMRKYWFEAFIRTELNVRSCHGERPQELSCPEESVQVTFLYSRNARSAPLWRGVASSQWSGWERRTTTQSKVVRCSEEFRETLASRQ